MERETEPREELLVAVDALLEVGITPDRIAVSPQGLLSVDGHIVPTHVALQEPAQVKADRDEVIKARAVARQAVQEMVDTIRRRLPDTPTVSTWRPVKKNRRERRAEAARRRMK